MTAFMLYVISPGKSREINTIAFANSLFAGKDPTYMVYDEKKMSNESKKRFWRLNLEKYVKSGSIVRSPRTLFEIDLLPMKSSPL